MSEVMRLMSEKLKYFLFFKLKMICALRGTTQISLTLLACIRKNFLSFHKNKSKKNNFKV